MIDVIGIQVGVPFHFRVSDQKLYKEIIASINADYQEMIKYPQKAKKRFCLICDVAYWYI